MTRVREGLRELFTEEMLLIFWTHEKCPPDQQEIKGCRLESDIKHERCAPCWEEWADKLVEKILIVEDRLGVVLKVEDGYERLVDGG